jgi:hypothetical protein
MKAFRWIISFTLFIILTVLTGITGCDVDDTDYNLENLELGISYPPMGGGDEKIFTKDAFDELNVKSFRMDEHWELREPEQDNFNWSPLDTRLDFVDYYGYHIVMTITPKGPDWANDPDWTNEYSALFLDDNDFIDYIENLLQRYPNRIDMIQFGNEWNTEYWYIGTKEDFVKYHNIVYDAVQSYSPETRVVLGGLSIGGLIGLAIFDGYLTSFYDTDGNYYDEDDIRDILDDPAMDAFMERVNYVLENAHYDIMDIHLYDDVENWDKYYQSVDERVDTPIIVTEFSGPNSIYEGYTEEFQAERLNQYIKTIDDLGIHLALFFKLVESGSAHPAHTHCGLFDGTDLSKKEAFYVFKKFAQNNVWFDW